MDVTNNQYDNGIRITRVKLSTPMGFIKLHDESYDAHEKREKKDRREEEEEERARLMAEGKKPPRFRMNKKFMKYVKGIAGDELNPDRLEFDYPLYLDQRKKINIGKEGHHRFEFAYRAGHWYGYRPKPDTHVISCTVDYIVNPDSQTSSTCTYQAHTDMEIAIYPSLTGMLFGAVLGSLLGTIAHTNNFAGVLHTILPQLAVNVKNLPDLNTLITTLLVNIILGFIAAVILMRRKNVESFITIEDFWGGILIGFVVGYSGFTAVQKLLGITTTSTQTAGLDVYFWH